MQKEREDHSDVDVDDVAGADDDDCGLTHFYAAANCPQGGKCDGFAFSLIFDPVG